MLRYLLDTDTCINVLRDRTPEMNRRFNEENAVLGTSTIVLFELHRGAIKSARPAHHRQKLDEFAARLTVLPFDATAADHAADIRIALERAGKGIGAYDMLIAGHARSAGLTVVTGNLREFTRVEGLRCEDWLGETAA